MLCGVQHQLMDLQPQWLPHGSQAALKYIFLETEMKYAKRPFILILYGKKVICQKCAICSVNYTPLWLYIFEIYMCLICGEI